MVTADHILGVFQPAGAVGQFHAVIDMRFHYLEFFFRESAGFQQNFVPDPEFADVMQQCALYQAPDLIARELYGLSQANRIDGYPVVVRVGIAVALCDGSA